MRRIAPAITLITLLVGSLGCDTERVGKLEARIGSLEKDLQTLRDQQKSANIDLQAKCAAGAKDLFKSNWPSDKDTILLTYTNHFNKSQNKCFISIEYHFNAGGRGDWVNAISIFDVYENVRNANFMERHSVDVASSRVQECAVGATKCTSLVDFDRLTDLYMTQ